MHIGIIGTGYVGLVTGACFAESGVKVTCIDNDKEKIRQLNNGTLPIYEPGLETMITRNAEKKRLFFSSLSTQVTERPNSAKQAPVTSPTYPVPIMPICITPPVEDKQ